MVHRAYLKILTFHVDLDVLSRLFSDATPPRPKKLRDLQKAATVSVALGYLTDQEFLENISFDNTFSEEDVISTILDQDRRHEAQKARAYARIVDLEAQVCRRNNLWRRPFEYWKSFHCMRCSFSFVASLADRANWATLANPWH